MVFILKFCKNISFFILPSSLTQIKLIILQNIFRILIIPKWFFFFKKKMSLPENVHGWFHALVVQSITSKSIFIHCQFVAFLLSILILDFDQKKSLGTVSMQAKWTAEARGSARFWSGQPSGRRDTCCRRGIIKGEEGESPFFMCMFYTLFFFNGQCLFTKVNTS